LETLRLDSKNMWHEYEKSKLAEGIKPKTLKDYKSILVAFGQWMARTYGTPFRVQPEHIERYFVYLRSLPANRNHPYTPPKKTPISAYRLRNIYIALRSYYSWMEERGIRESPMRHIRSPKLPQNVIEIYTKEEIARVIEYINSRQSPNNLRDTTIIQLFLATGLRASELLQITHRDVNLSERRIRVSRGKGSKQRIVPFNGASLQLLTQYLAELPNIRPQDRIFPISHDRCRDMFTRACKTCGVKPRGLHALRHTFACRFLLAGGSPLDLKYILGHSSLAMVDRYSQWVRQQTALQSYELVADRL